VSWPIIHDKDIFLGNSPEITYVFCQLAALSGYKQHSKLEHQFHRIIDSWN